MYINSVNNLNFQARIVKSVPILQKNNQNKYNRFDACLMEYDVTSHDDMEKIKEISKLPGFALYGYEIYQSLLSGNDNVMNRYCFVLVDNPQKIKTEINDDNILGLFTFREIKEEDKPDEVALFITNHKYRTYWFRKVHDNEFMHIGKGMAEALKTIFPKKSIKCYSERGAVEFWKKNGFREFAEQRLILKR